MRDRFRSALKARGQNVEGEAPGEFLPLKSTSIRFITSNILAPCFSSSGAGEVRSTDGTLIDAVVIREG